MADLTQLELPNGTTYDLRDSSKLPLAGGTMTGVLTLKGGMYEDDYNGALNANNSDIYNLNSIYTADSSGNAAEGIHFYRDATHVDTLWAKGGKLLFVPYRELGVSTTEADSQKVGRFTENPTTGQVVITSSADGGMKSSGYTIASSVPANAVFTDTKVTSVGNHYAPATDTSAELSASATGATAAWSIDVVQGVQLQRDAKGHVTGVTVTSGKIPANPNTDAKVKQTATDSTDANYELLFSATADNTTRTEGARKSSGLTYNPSITQLGVTGSDATLFVLDNTSSTTYLTTIRAGGITVDGLCQLQYDSHDIHFTSADDTWDGTHDSLKDALAAKSIVSFSRSLSSGTKIGTITINNTSTDLYCEINSDTKVTVSNTNPTSGTWYYPTWYTATSGTGGIHANDGFRYYSLQGTAEADGQSILQIGNSTATGTAGNKAGYIRIYGKNNRYAQIVAPDAASGNRTHTLPGTTGTILNTGTTSFTQSLSSGTKIGTIKINSTSTDIYCETNTDENVKQTATTDNKNYRMLFSYTDDATTSTEGVRRCDHFSFNPATSALNIRGTADGQNVGLVLYTNGGVAFNPFINDTQCGLYCSNGGGNIITRRHSDNLLTITGVTYSVSYPAAFRSAIGAAASSSKLTKKNIEDITEAEAKKILDIDVKSFDYKDAYILEGYPKRDKYYGVIAEDVLKQIPFVVNVPDDYDESKIDETKGLNQSLLTIDYDKFVPYLIKMVQIQQKEINELKQQITKTTN